MPYHEDLQVSDMMGMLMMSRVKPAVCDFCGESLRGISLAGLVVEIGDKKFCDDVCVESWIDLQEKEAESANSLSNTGGSVATARGT